MYAVLTKILRKVFKEHTIFKYGFNISPMYRRSTGRVIAVTEDLLTAKVKIPLSIKNRSYVGSIFGGSLFSATDPVFMIQLIHILGDAYVVWDKEATIRFRRPAKTDAYVVFSFSESEIETIKKRVAEEREIDLVKEIEITDTSGDIVYAQVVKTIYIADKEYYKNKRKTRKAV